MSKATVFFITDSALRPASGWSSNLWLGTIASIKAPPLALLISPIGIPHLHQQPAGNRLAQA